MLERAIEQVGGLRGRRTRTREPVTGWSGGGARAGVTGDVLGPMHVIPGPGRQGRREAVLHDGADGEDLDGNDSALCRVRFALQINGLGGAFPAQDEAPDVPRRAGREADAPVGAARLRHRGGARLAPSPALTRSSSELVRQGLGLQRRIARGGRQAGLASVGDGDLKVACRHADSPTAEKDELGLEDVLQ